MWLKERWSKIYNLRKTPFTFFTAPCVALANAEIPVKKLNLLGSVECLYLYLPWTMQWSCSAKWNCFLCGDPMRTEKLFLKKWKTFNMVVPNVLRFIRTSWLLCFWHNIRRRTGCYGGHIFYFISQKLSFFLFHSDSKSVTSHTTEKFAVINKSCNIPY